MLDAAAASAAAADNDVDVDCDDDANNDDDDADNDDDDADNDDNDAFILDDNDDHLVAHTAAHSNPRFAPSSHLHHRDPLTGLVNGIADDAHVCPATCSAAARVRELQPVAQECF